MNMLPSLVRIQRCAWRTLGLLAVIAFGATTAFPQANETGTVTGRVRNQASGALLSGASVTIAGTDRFLALTNDDGTFRINHVPAGQRTVVVNYTGLNTGSYPVMVAANGQANVDVELTSDIYTLEAFQVSSVREGQAAALNEQKNADNIITVVSPDAFGNVADTNVGNLLIKLSGISPERDEAEVYKISIRGINADLNSVSLDGTLLASASSRGTGRGFEVDKVSTNSIESIEVIKAPTPDMDADAIGGKINFKTKSGFDTKGRRIRYSLGSNVFLQRYERPADGSPRRKDGFLDFGRAEAHPSASIAYSDVLGRDQRWAITLNGSFNRTFSPRTAARLEYIDNTLNNDVVQIRRFQTTEDDILLDRIGVGGKVHFKLSPSTTLFFNFLYNDFNDEMTQHKLIFGNNGTNRVGTATYEKQAFRDRVDLELEARTRTAETSMFQIGGRTQTGDWDIDYDLSTSSSYATDKRVIMLLRYANITYEIDRSRSIYFPSITQIAGNDLSNYSNASFDALDRRWDQNWDDVTAGKLNVKRSFNTRYPSNLKAGLRYRHQERTQDRARPRFRAVNSAIGDLNRFRDFDRTVFPVEGRYQRWPWPDVRAVHHEIDTHPNLFTEDVSRGIDQDLANDLTAGERIYATYLMGTVKTGPLTSVAGLRAERTETYGTNVKINEAYATGNPLRYEEKQSSKGSYDNLFPGLHFRYTIAPNFNVRASFSTGIGRPGFTRLLPNVRVRDRLDTDDEDDEDLPRIEMNNPSLKPQFSDNYDIVLEYYFKKIGTLSAGVFRKEIDGFIFTNQRTIVRDDPVVSPIFGNQYADGNWKLRYPVNGGWARINGLELNYSQQLTFLPGFLNGFGIYANSTFLKTRGTYENDTVMDDISGFTKRSGNAGLSYIKHGYTARLSANYNGGRLSNYDQDPMKRRYDGARTSVDFSIKYNIPRRRASVFLDINNITNSKRTLYQANERLQRDTQIYGMRITAGLQGEF